MRPHQLRREHAVGRRALLERARDRDRSRSGAPGSVGASSVEQPGPRPRRSTLAAGAGARVRAAARRTPAAGRRRRCPRAARRAACCRCAAWRRRGSELQSTFPHRNRGQCTRETQHRLRPLARHRPLRAALRPPGADAEHPAARRPGPAVPPRVLRRADVLGQPRVPADRPVGALQRDDRPRPPRLRAPRLRPPHRPHAARRRLLDGARRRAAPLARPGHARLRPRGRHRQPPRRRGRAGRAAS